MGGVREKKEARKKIKEKNFHTKKKNTT